MCVSRAARTGALIHAKMGVGRGAQRLYFACYLGGLVTLGYLSCRTGLLEQQHSVHPGIQVPVVARAVTINHALPPFLFQNTVIFVR